MNYLYEKNRSSFEDFSSGRVLYNAHGTTSFPVRLASEIIQRCFHYLKSQGNKGPYTLYDPCCGGGYLLSVLGFLHGDRIRKIVASDIDVSKLELAKSNLSLLTPKGLAKREKQLKSLYDQYGKQSHLDALQSAERLNAMLPEKIDIHCSVHDITTSNKNIALEKQSINIVISDLPYGNMVDWMGESANPVQHFFNNIYDLFVPCHSVAAIISNEKLKIEDQRFRRKDYFKVGKRHVAIYELQQQLR